ncbi:CFEM domain-containing protein [Colletotrichum graminicola M1.001]|uniref:CFEM domain-containing protein n=1 Tax=Colletotrichum graminicola (strain M1.001 / M2 / FGSC 10212) TaxID=645133 RepID=E3QUL2_COLGM|nr:CFEM domain-containing protein [Colletotrichum graminicola M1.001]EFQ34550.1 CFEM domain-containing protein [Colletotrichum graminicola M1.001]
MAAAARLFFALLACFLGLGSIVHAATELSPSDLPSCALNCIILESSHTNCAVTNQTCLCADQAFMNVVETCVAAKCTVKEALVAKNATMSACGVPVVQHDQVFQYLRGILFALPTFFIIARLASKYLKLSQWGHDDTTIMVAYASRYCDANINLIVTVSGGARDIWTLTPQEITNTLLIVYIFAICYVTCLAAIKASILFLFLRVFPEGVFRRALWYTQLFNLLLLISFLAATIASCQPVEYFWIGWSKETEGKCIDVNVFGLCHGAINVALDVWMLALPISQIYQLKMDPKQKMGVMLMLGVGIFLVGVSAYRIRALTSFAVSFNATANTYETSIWSHIELCVGILVACLPSTRQLWGMVVPRIVKVTHASLTRSGKGSLASSQVLRSTPGGVGDDKPPRTISDEQSSVSRLMHDGNEIGLNTLGYSASVRAKATNRTVFIEAWPRPKGSPGSWKSSSGELATGQGDESHYYSGKGVLVSTDVTRHVDLDEERRQGGPRHIGFHVTGGVGRSPP